MEFFARAKAVRLRSHHDKYLAAEDDEERVAQDRDGSSRNARWTVERVDTAPHVLRFRSCYGRYLTASNEPFLLGVTGKKVTQTLPARLDSSLEWEPVRDGARVKLMTRYGNYLRGNGGLPPWRNSVTHDVPHRTVTQEWVFWDVDVVEVLHTPPSAPGYKAAASSSEKLPKLEVQPNPPSTPDPIAVPPSSEKLSRLESLDSFSAPVHKVEGRSVFYAIADDAGNVDDSVEWPHLTFKGTSVLELTERLKEETKIDDIIVCTRNPLNQHLIPLFLHLPPNNVKIRLVVVDANSKVAKNFNI
ncbi:uncharacterized protein LOC122010429 [Zingiber officinale]|uniref:DUF569 domain-containing protein n=1 Tax=Zingiber officinale TaxID=94328 RepID=A0A8J5FEQ6_ZINOF|nr:uncharacterized protein LOC122010429 [Zingiber officinale]KAG6488309.1 hypothetical protein ZIOFF_057071 [Zingiber officinale]